MQRPVRGGIVLITGLLCLIPLAAADTYVIEPGTEFQQADGFVTVTFTERHVADQVAAGQDALLVDDLELVIRPDAPVDVRIQSYNRSHVGTDTPVITMTMAAQNPTNTSVKVSGLPANTQYYSVFRDGNGITSSVNGTIQWTTHVPREETRYTIRSTAEPVVTDDPGGGELPGWIDPRIVLGGIGGLIAVLLMWKLYGWWSTRTRTALQDEIDRLQALVQTQVNARHDYDTDEILSDLRTARGHLNEGDRDAAREAVDAVREQLQEEVEELPDRADTGL